MFVKLSNFSKFCKSFFNKQSFFIQIFIINSIISICILSAVTAVILLSSLIHTKQILISNCRNMATNLAQNYIVYDALVSKRATRRLLTYLDNTLDKSDTIDSITIIDTNRICLYHYDHAVTGTTIPVIPEEYDDQITTISIGTDERGRPIKQLSAVVPILNGSGAIFGYAIVGIFARTLNNLNRSYMIRYIFIVIVAVIGTFAASYYIVSGIRKSLMGYEPKSFANLLIKRNEVLDNLSEGLIAIDMTGRITVCTPAARRLFNLPYNYEGRSINQLQTLTDMEQVIRTGRGQYNKQLTIGKNKLLTDYVPLKEYNKLTGAVVIIRDHTAFTQMAEELTGFRFVVDALRSNVHNFKNELHVILGMLQLGENDLAIEYITHFNAIATSQSSILKNIENKTIAALILGKLNEAKEQGIELFVDESSTLQRHNPYLNSSQLTVVLGNLLENSIEATACREKDGEINLYIASDNDSIKINVDDNGCGIPSELQERLFERGFTTKKTGDPQNHGIGLYSVNEIVKECNGIIQIDSSPGEGTSVTIQITKKRAGYEKKPAAQEVQQ